MSFENLVPSPHPQLKTVVIGLDDAAQSTSPEAPNVPSEVYVYIGTKTKQGSPIERAGLTNGRLYGLKAIVNGRDVTEESNALGLGQHEDAYVGSGLFQVFDFGDVSNLSGNDLQAASIAAGVTRLQRVEDGAWDPRPRHRNDFYFVTTASFDTNSRLWRLRFDDIEQPEKGGTIDILLTGGEGHRMLDNIAIDRRGRILMQEDVGNNPRLGKIWLYDIDSALFIEVAADNEKFFAPGTGDFLTADDESSGIIDASRLLGPGWFLLDVQAHFPIAGELVEGGQLLAMYVDPSVGSGSDEEEAADEEEGE